MTFWMMSETTFARAKDVVMNRIRGQAMQLSKTGSAIVLAVMAQQAVADVDAPWSIEGELEVGVEAITSAEDPDAEVRDVFLSIEVEGELELSDRITLFSSLSLESVTDAEDDRAFEDLGLYVGEIGLAFDLDPVTLSVGKISPAFGSAWDTAPGYFGADFAEDYELEEMIGASAAIELGEGELTLSVFYPDDTRLSDSFGTRRGRNRADDGDVGNTGRLDNFALQYDHEFDTTTLHFGLRHLSRGQEDFDENGAVLGVTQAIGENVALIAEVAQFNHWEGSEERARIATLGASFEHGAFTYSAAIGQRHFSDAPTDRLIALGVDYEFDNGMVLSAGFARTTEEEEKTEQIAVSLTLPFGD